MSPRIFRPTAGLTARYAKSQGRSPWSTSRFLRCSSSTSALPRHDRPFRMAVVGSGPAGFYTTDRVMQKIVGAKVDMYESLPVPFGLVRFGVAPDHPEVKNCEEKFRKIASSPNFTFIGNVAVGHAPAHPNGQSVPLHALLRHYDAVLFAYGAAKDRALGIPGESLKRVYSAREFVGWYNGLPEFANLNPDLSQESAVIIGQGNVALDVARILLEDISNLAKTDIAEYALEALIRNSVKEVTVVGRRAPMQASFANAELRELIRMPYVTFGPVEAELVPDEQKQKTIHRARKRVMETLAQSLVKPFRETPRSWNLDFCLSPTEFHPDSSDFTAVGATSFKKNVLTDIFDPKAEICGSTGEIKTIPSPLVFRSIGYKSVPLPEFRDLGISFDEQRGVIGNDGPGRVARADMERAHFPGLYCAGWVKRGPTGVIASTMYDALETTTAIVADWVAGEQFLGDGAAVKGRGPESAGWDGVRAEGNKELGKCAVDWEGWLAIDRAERENGKRRGKERDKIVAIDEMLSLAAPRNKEWHRQPAPPRKGS